MPLVTTGNIYRPYLRAAIVLGLAAEHQYTAIWRPGRAFIVIAAGYHAFTRAIRPHHPDIEATLVLFGEGQKIAARAPDRGAVAALPETDSPLIRAVHIHHIDLLRAAAI